MAKPSPLLLGIEIGGTKLQVGAGPGDGTLVGLERRRVVPAEGSAGILRQIEEATAALLSSLHVLPEDLGAVGIGFGGPVDADRGVATTSHQVDGWDQFPLADWTRENLGVGRVSVQNDADTAALGEARYGAGEGISPVLYVTIGSGIGGGLVVDGQIYRGAGRGAVEIGHLIVAEGPASGGAGATLERIASGWSIGREGSRRVQELLAAGHDCRSTPLLRRCSGDPAQVTALLVGEAAADGDPVAEDILREAVHAMGRALAHAVTLLAPARIILGGGVSLLGEERWFGPIRRAVEERAFPPFRGGFDIVPASLGEEVVVHGALALAADRFRDQ